MPRASKRMLAHAWMLVVAALSSLAFGGVTLADEPSGDVLAVAEQVAPPAPAETAAPAPEPTSAPVTPDAPATPAPEAPPAPPAEPAPAEAPAPEQPAPAPEAAPDAGAPESPPTEPEPTAEDGSGDKSGEPEAPTAGVGGKAAASRAKREGQATPAGDGSFRDNPCRTNRRSTACAQFLYPGTCADADSRECREFLAVNPCARDTTSESCQAYIENACFERPNGPSCLFIRGALTEPGNPCRQNPNSQECDQHASREQCEFRGLSGLDCSVFLAFLRSFTAQEAAACASMLNPDNGRPPAGSLCELYVAVFRLACDKDAFICIVPFGGSRESLGRPAPVGGGGSDEGGLGGGREGLLGSRGGGGAGRDLLISDPGARGNLGGRTAADRRRGRDADRPLAQTGKGLDQFIVVGLLLFGAGAALRLRARRRSDKVEPATSA